MPESNFVARIEVGQIQRDTRTVGGFGHRQEPSTSRETTPIEHGRLNGRYEAPKHDHPSAPDVRLEMFPAHKQPLRENVGNVEDCAQQLVAIATQVNVILKIINIDANLLVELIRKH